MDNFYGNMMGMNGYPQPYLDMGGYPQIYPQNQQQLLIQQQQQAMMMQQQRDMFIAQQQHAQNIERNFYNKMLNSRKNVYPRTIEEKEYFIFCQLGCNSMGETVYFTNLETFPLTEAVFTIKDSQGRVINAQKQIGIKHACTVRKTFIILPVKNAETGYPYINIPVADGRFERTQVCHCEACNKMFHTAFTPA